MIFKYGSIIREERIVNGSTAKEKVTYTQSIQVHDNKEVIAEFLKLCDDHKSGKIRTYGMTCIVDDSGHVKRIEKSWTV